MDWICSDIGEGSALVPREYGEYGEEKGNDGVGQRRSLVGEETREIADRLGTEKSVSTCRNAMNVAEDGAKPALDRVGRIRGRWE